MDEAVPQVVTHDGKREGKKRTARLPIRTSVIEQTLLRMRQTLLINSG